MGQVAGAWCGEGVILNSDVLNAVGRSRSQSHDVALEQAAARLLEGCPRELAEALRDTGRWDALLVRPWLSTGALRGVHRSLQRCNLVKLADRHHEAQCPEECTYALPPTIAWTEMDLDHVVSAGQVFRREDAAGERIWHMRRNGFQLIRQGKVGVVLLAGGLNLRLGLGEPPVACTQRILELYSGKSILQLCCERIRRIVHLCRDMEEGSLPVRHPSLPVFVMTSRLTHRNVVDHFETHKYFGLSPRDVFFFEQPVAPAFDESGRLLPQSLGGEFAHAPGGTGQVLSALATCSALEQMRDRGVECLHFVGTENVLARVCDPVFLGFCRELDVDCAAKIVERLDPREDLELFCIRQAPVTTQFADTEEAACGVQPTEAPEDALLAKNSAGALSLCGCINSVFMAVSYIEDVVGRPVRSRRVRRVVPHLDFHLKEEEPYVDSKSGEIGIVQSVNSEEVAIPPRLLLDSRPAIMPPPPRAGQSAKVEATASFSFPALDPVSSAVPPVALRCKKQSPEQQVQLGKIHTDGAAPVGVLPGSWPAETSSLELACQRALLVAASEVRAACPVDAKDTEAAWRCDVQLDGSGPLAVVRVRGAKRGPLTLLESLASTNMAIASAVGSPSPPPLLCSLVVPSKPNAYILDISLLDYFVYTDRAVAFEVDRTREFAPVREGKGRHTPQHAKRALHALHLSWALTVGATISDQSDSEGTFEISPLLSYDGEGLVLGSRLPSVLKLPQHILGDDEIHEDCMDGVDEVDGMQMDGLDNRLFYLQEYPQRKAMSHSHMPQFRTGSRQPTEAQPTSFDLGVSASTAGDVAVSTKSRDVGHGNGTPGVSEQKPKGVKMMPTSAPPYEVGAVELPTGFAPCVGAMVPAASATGFWEKPA
eukprot:TRINITY_DN44444_c0_g1_i1.p1 TRINITY_DN44444_c0_g1~~TRINITY_DN44444_c0_g1_i1.p1  ORF type:complete len:882 (+),score=132.16 TRINITY_DN44444_c0_g1_i1:269-2914(+)